MSSHPDQEWLDRSNADTILHLERQGRTGPGLVPFLGAGVSMSFGFKSWAGLLRNAAPPPLHAKVEEQLTAGDYEGAAETLLQELGADGFQNMVAAAAGDNLLSSLDFRHGTVALLPLLASGPVVTTNFDRVLERVFEVHGVPFQSIVSGPRPDLIVDALHGNRRVLIKLHGDWQDRVGRTFARSDYDANYGSAQPQRKRALLEATEELLFSSRSMLFLGASLGPDRTVDRLMRVHRQFAGIRHFAVVQAPESGDEFDKRVKHLRKCGVLPLWYRVEPPEQHGPPIEALMQRIVERISVRTIAVPPPPASRPPQLNTIISPPPLVELPHLNAHFDRVVRLVEDGRIAFFLGTAIHSPTLPMAREFYRELARIFECEALGAERFAVAQYIADRYGRENLYGEIRKVFRRSNLLPRDTHELFAAWPQLKTTAGENVPFPLVLTTNYDDTLERRLAEVGLPYHLFSYQADGPHHGLFYHRTPDDGLRIIERPDNITELAEGFVVVKLNGGFSHLHPQIPESYATTRLDYWDLAARLPSALPATIRRRVSSQSLLFLGHGLRAADVESFIRFAHRDHPGPRSWAVVRGLDDRDYWEQVGVELIDVDVHDYVNVLRRRLTA
jgi:SIR2-like protein